jgi:hypothetical protein
VAFRRLGGESEINMTHRRHTWRSVEEAQDGARAVTSSADGAVFLNCGLLDGVFKLCPAFSELLGIANVTDVHCVDKFNFFVYTESYIAETSQPRK